MVPTELTEVLISGAVNGSAYALMAVGLALVYGIAKVFNFCYGSFYTMGGYLGWLVLNSKLSRFGYPVVFACAIPALFMAGLAIDRIALRPIRDRKDWEMLAVMSTLGIALFLDNLYLARFGPSLKALRPLFEGTINLAGTVVSMHDVAISIIAASMIIGLWFFLKRTRTGMAMEAIAQDMTGAKIVGIARDRVFGYAFAIASVLVGIGGILLAPKYFVTPFGGWEILVKAWVITAFGGMGNILGAVYAAFILGIVESIVFWQFGATYTMFAWVAIMIGIFIVRPQGLRGTWG